MAQRPLLRLPDPRALKNSNFVIASKAKQSLFEIAKSALSLVLRLLQDFVLRNDIRGNFAFELHFSELSILFICENLRPN